MISWSFTAKLESRVNCMSNKQVIQPADLSHIIRDTLELYSEDVQRHVDKAGKKAVDELVRITRDTAPYDAKHHGRHFVSCIASGTEKNRTTGNLYIWYVKTPCYRLTHLLVYGHMDRTGKHRIRGSTFLHDAWEKVRPEYEQDVEEAVRDAGG